MTSDDETEAEVEMETETETSYSEPAQMMSDSGFDSECVFGSSYLRTEISHVYFVEQLDENTINGELCDTWNISVNEGHADAVIVKNTDNISEAPYDLYIVASAGVYATDCRALFANYDNVQTIDFGNVFHTDEVESMAGMFSECSSVKNLDLHTFNTSQVESMESMFYGCYQLESLDVSSFDTSQVDSMMCMFSECRNLESLDLNHFDVSSVFYMGAMFWRCEKLEDLKVDQWQFSSYFFDVYNMFLETPYWDKSTGNPDLDALILEKK